MWPFKKTRPVVTREAFGEGLWLTTKNHALEIAKNVLDEESVKELSLSNIERSNLFKAILIALLWASRLHDQNIVETVTQHYLSYCTSALPKNNKDWMITDLCEELNESYHSYSRAFESAKSVGNFWEFGVVMAYNWVPRLGKRQYSLGILIVAQVFTFGKAMERGYTEMLPEIQDSPSHE